MIGALRHQWSLLRYGFRKYGAGGLVVRLMGIAKRSRRADPFDAEYGIETARELTPEEAGVPPERAAEASLYFPSDRDEVLAAIAALGWSAERRRAATFVDLGAGKGRVLVLAAEAGFGSVVGVEISPMLADRARENVAMWKRRTGNGADVQVVCGDAGSFEVPDAPLVVFLYHPFSARVAGEAMRRVVESLTANPREAAILYLWSTTMQPIPPEVFACAGRFVLGAEGPDWSVWRAATGDSALARIAGR